MKNLTILFCTFFLFFFTKVAAQLFSPAQAIIEKGFMDASEIEMADVDNDGDLDAVVSAQSGESHLLWFPNTNGLGFFDNPNIISSQLHGANSVSVADMDGDSDLDIVSFSNDDYIAWFENLDGLGNFGSPHFIINEIQNIANVEVADVDGDGDHDFIAVSEDDDLIIWLENLDGNGNFGAKKLIYEPAFGYIGKMKIADMDGDSDPDIVLLYFGKLTWLKNLDGLGNFGAPITIASPSLENNYDFDMKDMDGDGDKDIVYCWNYSNDGNIKWYKNLDGLGTFSTANNIYFQYDETVSAVEAEDFDGDGDTDLASFHGYSIKLHINTNGIGSFTSSNIPNLPSSFQGTAVIMDAADVDNDGDQDLLAIYTGFSVGTERLAVFYNLNGQGGFSLEASIPSQSVDFVTSLTHADFDNDNDLDFISSSRTDSKIAWYENTNGIGDFPVQHIITQHANQATDAAAADMDNDGDQDVIVSACLAPELTLHKNNGGIAQFEPPTIISNEASCPGTISIADINNDGWQDVVADGSIDASIAWYENMGGTGSFTKHQTPMPITNGSNYQTGDFDSDGDLDILAEFDYSVAWFKNTDGQGNFTGPNYITTNSSYFNHTAIGDIDEDGDLDIIVASENEKEISWYKNLNGQGNFSNKIIIAFQFLVPRDIRADDLDNDGDLDLLVGVLIGPPSLFWYENTDGQGNFSNKIPISTTSKVLSINAADFDNDHDLDLIYGGEEDITQSFNQLINSEVNGVCYFDKNENGIYEIGEPRIKNHPVTLLPNGTQYFTNYSGRYRIHLTDGNYTITTQAPTGWFATTPISHDFQYFANGPAVDPSLLNFGFYPINPESKVQPNIASAPTKCDYEVPFWVNCINNGTSFTSGYVTFELDNLTSFISAVPAPDNINGNKITWNFTNLAPTHIADFKVLIQMPDVSHWGELLTFQATSYLTDANGAVFDSFTDAYFSELTCAFDPNDKLVKPQGTEPENYTLFGEELEYTIRFQNTGNETATVVVIQDQLAPQLDLSTFHPIAASHSYRTELSENGLVNFIFNPIQLPDSLTNEPASHGFVKFRIRPLDGLPDFTSIQNTASIFFDSNPAIITNTTLNTLVPFMPAVVSYHLGCTGTNSGAITITPVNGSAPFEFTLDNGQTNQTGSFTNLSPGNYILTVTDANGHSQQQPIQITELPFPIPDLGPDLVLCHTDLPYNISPGEGFETYDWQDGSTQPNLVITSPTTEDDFTVTVTDVNGCSNSDTIHVTVQICDAANEKPLNDASIQLFPNPAHGKAFLHLQGVPPDAYTFHLSNTLGQIKMELSAVVNQSIETIPLNLERLNQGLYFVMVKSRSGQYTLRLMVD